MLALDINHLLTYDMDVLKALTEICLSLVRNKSWNYEVGYPPERSYLELVAFGEKLVELTSMPWY
jgi:hypothetical protein